MGQAEVILKVRDLMNNPLIYVESNDSVIEVAKLMDRKKISSVLVKNGKNFVGIITDTDIVERVVSKEIDPRKVVVTRVMSSPIITISAEATIEDAAEKMRKHKIRRLIVEEDHEKVGIIVESDMIRIEPEMHLLIRERSKLEAQLTEVEPREVTFSGICEECGNYSEDLKNVNGGWLCEECVD